METLMKLWLKISGWKTIIAYVLLQLPWFSENPMVVEAIEKVLADVENPVAWGELIVQVLLAVGVIHRITKNVKGKKDE